MRPDLIRVVLIDDHAIVRAGLKAILAPAKDIMVVGEGGTGREALSLAERLDPHVVVMDLSMPEMDGLAATRELVKATSTREVEDGTPPTQRVLMLTMHSEDEHLVALLEAGAAGYLLKTVAERELVDAVRTVAAGDIYVQPSAARALARGLARKEEHADDRSRFARLTEREQEVLTLFAEGHTAPEIGERLSISPKTVDTYKQRINEKLHIAHRTDYVKLALRLGLLSTDK